MCRCVWSPVLKEEFEIQSKQKKRQIKNRSPITGNPWLSGAILAAILIPEELFGLGILAAGVKLLINKAGSAKLARAAIANKINQIDNSSISSPTPPTASKTVSLPNRVSPIIIANGLDLRGLDLTQLRSLIPSLSEQQALKILVKQKGNFKVKTFQDLASILDVNQFRQLKAIARQNNLLNLLHPSNNLTPSAIWVNSGGIIPKNKTKAVFELIKNNNFSSVEELLEMLRKEGIDIQRLNNYAVESFDRSP